MWRYILANSLALLFLINTLPAYANVSDSDFKLYIESGSLFNGDDSFNNLEALTKDITNATLAMLNESTSSQARLNQQLKGLSLLLDKYYVYLNKLNMIELRSLELVKIRQQSIDFFQGFYMYYVSFVELIKAGNTKKIQASVSTLYALKSERDLLLQDMNKLAEKLKIIRDEINQQYGSLEAAMKHFDKPVKSDYQIAVEAYDNDNYKLAFEKWSVLANNGEAKAQYNLGVMYSKGKGVDKNYNEALFWFNKAAQQGHLQAARNARLLEGKKMPSVNDEIFNDGLASYQAGNYERAMALWVEAAKKGDARAEYNIGVMYHKGKGVPVNQAEAAKWYHKAASQGHDGAIKNLKILDKSNQ